MRLISNIIRNLLLDGPLQGLHRKMGGPELTQEEIAMYKEMKFPRYYIILYFAWAFIFCISFIVSSMFLSFYLIAPKIFELQKNIFGVGAIYFTSDIGFISGLATLFGNLFLIGGIIGIPLFILTPKNFKNFHYKQQSTGGWYGKVNFRVMLNTAIICYVLAIPFIILGFRDYKAVFDDRIVVQNFLVVGSKSYTFSEIKNVKVYSEVDNDSENDYMDYYIVFHFINNRNVFFLFDNELIPHKSSETKQLYSKLRSEKVELKITPPSEEILHHIDSLCRNRQEFFYTLFEINKPVRGIKCPFENKSFI